MRKKFLGFICIFLFIFSTDVQSKTGEKLYEKIDLFGEVLEKIKKEVEEAKNMFKKYKWPTIDVTRKSVEETAASIIKIYEIYKNNG